MSYYDDSSLFVAPNGYKTSVLFAQKPMDANGQLAFTRSNDTATRVAENGLIQKVRTNLLLQSVWPNIGTGVAPTSWTASQLSFSAGPLAGQLLCNTSASRGFITQTVSLTAGQYALSVFVDSVTTSGPIGAMISIFGATSLKYYEDGTEVISSTNIVAGKRYAVVGTVATGSFPVRIGSGVSANATSNYVISRPQLEASDFGATDYIPTTTTAVSVGPVANVPRIDYTGGGCGKLLLEPQRTNSILWSEQLQNWSSTNTTVATNVLISPDGTQNADTIQLIDNTSRVFQALSLGAGTYTASVYAKYVSGSGPVRFNLVVDGANISFEFTPTAQFARFTYTFTATTGVTSFQLRGITGTTGTVSFWGVQLEVGSYATSYIPTLGASVTRGADLAQKTSATALIGQAEGVLFVDLVMEAPEETRRFSLSDGTTSNRILIGQTTSGNIVFYTASIGAAQVSFTTSTSYTKGTRLKIAFAYKENDFTGYINGEQIFTDSLGTVPSTTKFSFSEASDSSIFISSVNQALLFKTRLPNSELASLTNL